MAVRADLQQKIEDELALMHDYLLTLEGTDPMPLFPRLDANARHAVAVRLARLVELWLVELMTTTPAQRDGLDGPGKLDS